MIANMMVSESIHDRLHKSPYTFHLTGSKFFSGNGKDTDYFTGDSGIELDEWLVSLGFKPYLSTNYKDTNCLVVYRMNYPEKIDIQVVKDVELKNRVQERFKSLQIFSPTQEEWNLAFLLLA